MKKSVVKLSIYIVIVAFLVVVVLIAKNLLDRENILERISTWPDLNAKTLDGVSVSTGHLLDRIPVILVYFNTECIFCQQKFAEIHADGQLQYESTLVFISNEPPEIISNFREEMGLNQEPGFVFLYDENRTLHNHFGIRSVPATYLYSREGKLIQFYRGLVSTEKLRAHLLTDKPSNGE